MPIHPAISIQSLSQDDFDHLDAVVMQHAYSAQNKLGRLFDERVYENQMAKSLRAAGFEVHTQVPIVVSHDTFSKTYYYDLVVNRMLYEVKTVASWVPDHEAQALHYAMLANVNRTKLINFRTEKVQGKLCYTSLTREDRNQQKFCTVAWRPQSVNCDRLLQQLKSVVDDWGTHLSTRLYNEAMIHFCGGEGFCLQRIPVCELGTYLIQSHSPGLAFLLTSLSRDIYNYRQHLQRLINHLDIELLQWFNFNHSTIDCETVYPEK